ncbi:FAD-binding oxidoreductase [soil metagenome]
MTNPTAPIELTGSASRFGPGVDLPAEVCDQLAAIAPVVDDPVTRAETSRDWWPLALHWSLDGQVPAVAGLVCRPSTTEQVAAIAATCSAARVPLTVAAGRSGVSGGSVPVHGGVVLDITGLTGIVDVDVESGVVAVRAGMFGPDLDAALVDHGLTIGHLPQSYALATVGGWVACRGAGQYSTRYGKIEDLVVGLEVVLADGRVVRTGGTPAAATGPDLDELFCGSEGTLGIITTVWLRAHRIPATERRAAYAFSSFAAGVAACRQVLQAGATPAVLRLYDEVESMGSGRGGDGSSCTLLVLDEGHPTIVDATMAVVAEACAHARPESDDLVATWLEHRNDTGALQALTRQGYVVDTLEVAAPWSRLMELFTEVRAALLAVPGTKVASCHLSHSYPDGACLYFTFVATPDDGVEATYVALWDAGQRAALAHGANVSHHHGIGLNRGRFMAEALGAGADVLALIKGALDPAGILNPGKLGLPSPFGPPPWPVASGTSR